MTRRRFNWQLLLYLATALAVLALVTSVVHGWQAGRHARTLIVQSLQAEQEGNLARAENYLERYLVFNPNDTDALAHCGELLERLAVTPYDQERTLKIYQQVVARQPARHQARRRLALQAMRLGWFLDARTHLEVLLERQPNQADLAALLGDCHSALGEFEQAAQRYQQSLSDDPAQRDVSLRLARLLQGPLDRPEKAGEVMDQMVEAGKDSADAYLERALYRMAGGALAEAAADMARAQQLAPHDPRILLAAADMAMRRGGADEARQCLLRLRDRQPQNVTAHLTLASLEVREGHLREAAAGLRRGLEAVPDQPDLLAALAEVRLAQEDFTAAAEVIGRLRRRDMPAGLADVLDGQMQLRRRDWSEGLRRLEGVLQRGEAAPAVLARAALAVAGGHERLGNADCQLAALRQAVKLDPASGPALLALGAALETAGRADEALEQYRQAAALPHPPEETWLRLAGALTRRFACGPVPQRNWDEVDRLLDRAGRAPSQGVATAVARAEALLAQGRPADARTALEKARESHPNQAAPWTALANLEARRGDAAGADRVLSAARLRLGDSFELRLAQAELAAQQGPRAAAAALHRLEEGVEKFSAEEQQRLLCRVAEAWFALGEKAEGEHICRLLADRRGLDLAARVRLLEVALHGGGDALVGRLTADVRRLEGEEGTWWRYGEAARLVGRARRGDRAALTAAAALAQELASRRPEWARVPLLRACVAELAADVPRAIDEYRRAFDLGERQPSVAGRLARLLAERGRDAEADDVLRRQEQAEPLRGGLARLAADVAVRIHNSARAGQMARRAVPADSRDFRDQVWLGQVLALAGDTAEAEAALRRAVLLGPEEPEAWLALVAYLARAGADADAATALAEARRQLPAELVPLTAAIVHETLGRIDDAEKEFQEALKRTPDDGLVLQRAASFFVRLDRPAQAVPLLRRLIASGTDVPDANRAWARRQLALALAYDGDEQHHAEALALVQADAAAGRVRDFVAAARPAGRAAALRRLEASLAALPPTADERFRLARLYEAAGDADKAREHSLEALTQDMHNPTYLAHHIELLLRAGRADEARPWLARLEKLEPGSARVKAFRSAAEQAEP
jgi:tetratricopeptide (TPR) repeat protein